MNKMAAYRARQVKPQHHGQIRNEGTSCLHFDYESLAEATRGFNQRSVAVGGCKLGEGGFGPVFKGDLLYTEVAIKVLRRAPPVCLYVYICMFALMTEPYIRGLK